MFFDNFLLKKQKKSLCEGTQEHKDIKKGRKNKLLTVTMLTSACSPALLTLSAIEAIIAHFRPYQKHILIVVFNKLTDDS